MSQCRRCLRFSRPVPTTSEGQFLFFKAAGEAGAGEVCSPGPEVTIVRGGGVRTS